jgi:hypothetical protein
MTTVTLDPNMRPVFTGTVPLRQAVRRLIDRYKADAEKLERMNHWPESRAIWRDIHELEALLRTDLLDRIADELKEALMTPEMGN